MRIVFMGTPEFAVPSLRILVENNYNIVGVVTATDKMGGRGGKSLIESDVKKYAASQGLHILQPKNLKSPAFIDALTALKADLQIVVAFRMLPEVVWNMPPHGTYNLHGSLLPKYRGAAPIHWAVINGEKETGVTSFKLKHEIDTGDIFLQKKIPIPPTATTGDVYTSLMQLGAEVVLETVKAIENGEVELKPQDLSLVSKAPKIFKEDCEIDFDQPAEQVFNFIRGMNPYPTAWTTLDGKMLKVYKAEAKNVYHNIAPGKMISDKKSYLKITCRTGLISLKEIQMQGKRKMSIDEFLNGYEIGAD